MLSGSMDLCVVLPNNHSVRLNVERSTPMLDLLVQVTTAHKMSPGSHYLQVYDENGLPLPYKPSTPIGTLDAVTIHVVPKTGGSLQSMVAKRHHIKPFEKTFRLQVNLPHNQLYVMRTNGNTKLADILNQICQTKNLDPSKYSLRHPVNTDKVLCLSQTIADHNLQQLALVPKSDRPLGVSTVDIIGLKSSLDRCDESLSSGSLGGRSLSPTRSDASTESPPLASVMPPPRPGRKRRPAPKPPQLQSQTSVSSSNSDSHYLISHSRNSSDSSGYHEASLLSESPESNSLPDSLPRRSKLSHHSSNTNLPAKFKMSQSCSNLNSASTGLSLYKKSNISSSSVSLSSAAVRKKKPAPLPPSSHTKMSALPEEKTQTLKSNKVMSFDMEEEMKQKSATLPSSFPSPPVHRRDVELPPSSSPTPPTECCSSIPFSKVPQPKPRTKLFNADCEIPKVKRRAPSPPKRMKLDSLSHDTKDVETSEPNQSLEETKDPSLACEPGNNAQESFSTEFKLDDEIDRIFHNATKDYETPSLTYTEVNEEPESLQWEYKLPDPPTAFRDMNNSSPTLTEFDTVTISNLTEIVSKNPLENNLVIHTETSNGICVNDEISPKPKKFANEMIVSVTIENDYKKYKPDDEGSDSKQNSMGNDSGLELDDASSKIYENNNQKNEVQNRFNDGLETIPRRETNNNHIYSRLNQVNGLDMVDDGAREECCVSNRQYQQTKDNNSNEKLQEKYSERNSQIIPQEAKMINDYDNADFRKPLSCKESSLESAREEVNVGSKKHLDVRNETNNEPKSNPIVSTVNKNNKERGCKDIINKRDEDKKESKVTDTKSAVINELSSFINESKVGVRELATLINDKNSRTAKPKSSGNPTSSLINFKISTYENIKRPISIYCDDSVVVASKPKDEKPKTNIPKINRHNSLSQYDRPDMSSAMKRSSSYISLLSNPVKFNLQKFDKFFSSSCENLEAPSNLRRTSSELSIDKENNSIIKLKESRKEVLWKRSAQNMSELQSLQVLKTILPRLSVAEETGLEKENIIEPIESEPEPKKEEAIPKEESKAPKQEKDVTRRYSYQGTPDVNFATWNERPKVKVNIKTDKDYKIGSKFESKLKTNALVNNFKPSVNNNFNHVNDVVNGVPPSPINGVQTPVEKKDFAEKIENRNISMRLVSRTNSYKRPVSTDLSPHAPIVRAVELKKPLAYINGNVTTAPKVTRPMSCYLFGENVDCYKTNNHVTTRDMLLESIRSFGKNSLKKVN
ncbi:hypothetical protein M8J75_006773 [Diaphorina citri]|nr:hypothetical protein M8J75_006773 [Diaphorina citri]KAI5730874.1 hypothetical protein M8J77_001339 [Diaphorina citri]